MPELTAAMMAYIRMMTAVLGLCMGSFLNCFAYRYTKRQSVMKGRSQCALCGHPLSALDLIPVISWLLLRGKCRHCGGVVSVSYLLAELICGAAYVSVLFRFGLALETLRYLILVSLLFTAAATDLYGGLIPDRLTVIGAVCAFGFALLAPEGSAAASLLWTLVNGLSVALPLLFFVLAFDKIMQKETMGGGDLKLMFLIGLYFDWKLNILILILACVIGLLFAAVRRPGGSKHKESGAVSFGPALALAAWAALLCGDQMLGWYLGFFL